MVILIILTIIAMAVHIWLAEPNATIRLSLVKGLMFGAVYGSYNLESEDTLVKASHYQMSLGFIILTIEWYNEYE